jgi:hypothetical protein
MALSLTREKNTLWQPNGYRYLITIFGLDRRNPMAPFELAAGFCDAQVKWIHGVVGRIALPLHPEWEITALRNEVVGFQVLLSAREDFVLVTDEANWLHKTGFVPRIRIGHTIQGLPERCIEVFPVGYVEGDDRRLYAEYFEPGGYAEVPAHRPQPVYFRIRVPKELAPGRYSGIVRIFSQYGFEDEQQVWEGKITLNISALVLPDPKEWSFHLDLWQHCTAIARYHHVQLWSDAHFELIEGYYASIAQIGQKAVSIIATEMPWSGQMGYRDQNDPAYLFEHAVISVRKSPDSAWHYDYGKLDRQLGLAEKYGIDREIEVFGLLNIWVDPDFGFGKVAPDAPDAIRVRYVDEATGRFEYMRTAEEISGFIQSLHQHFMALGVLGKVRICADEPADLALFTERLKFVQAAAPGFRYKVAINHFEFMQGAPEEVIDYVPVLPLACKDPAITAQRTAEVHSRGGKMLWYVCCWPPFPNTFVHSPLVEARLHGWLSYFLKLDGFLRWAFCLWPSDPWKKVSWRSPEWKAGDMYFVLPGNNGKPVETLRYEGLRSAVQDYELLKMAERDLSEPESTSVFQHAFECIIKADQVNGLSDPLHGQPEDFYSLNPVDYQSARAILIKALES